jgi:lipoprotein-anchoring transpeptidase ErfK/SrfK
MVFRTSGAVLGGVATLVLGLALACGEAAAQYYPAQRAYPLPPTYHRYQPVPIDDEYEPFYDPPMIQSRPLPPIEDRGVTAVEPLPPPNIRYQRGGPVYSDEAGLAPIPPGDVYRAPQEGNATPYDPGARIARPNYAPPPVLPPPAGAPPSVPAAGAPLVIEQNGNVRPPLPIAPEVANQGATGGATADPRMAALPPDVRPETGPAKELPAQFRRTLVDYRSKEPAGTIVIDTQNTYLYLVLEKGKAMRYGVGVGREGFTWSGAEKVTRMAEWPDWHPPEEMIERQPYLPRFMAGGPTNPLGARALYLGKTVYRIHGTNQPSTIGSFVSSGCIRLTNEDIMDLYGRIKVGTRVVVLPGRAPATASATPVPPNFYKPAAPTANVAPLAPPASVTAR